MKERNDKLEQLLEEIEGKEYEMEKLIAENKKVEIALKSNAEKDISE